MRIYYQLLSLRTAFSSPALLLVTDAGKYLFNAGEDLQRLIAQRKLGMNAIRQIFLTRLNAESAAGLPGLLITLMNGEEVPRNVTGPRGLIDYFEAAKAFMDIKSLSLTEVQSGSYQDELMTITAVQTGHTQLSYIIAGAETQHSLIGTKAKELGIKGPMFRELLTTGKVTVRGRTVRVEEVSKAKDPRFLFAIADVEDSGMADKLVDSLSAFPRAQFELSTVVHFSPMSVLCDPQYRKTWERLNASHVLSSGSEQSFSDVFPRVEAKAKQRHTVVPALFPLLRIEKERPSEEIWKSGTVSGKFFMKYSLLPYRLQGFEKEDAADRSEGNPAAESPLQLPDCSSYFSRVASSVPGNDPILTFLGTGSSLPSLSRNVASIYLSDWGGGLLLDCGEGTYTQLTTHFGTATAWEIIAGLTAVIITHRHADHHLGLARLLAERQKVTSEPLTVVAPLSVQSFLGKYTDIEERSYRFVPNSPGDIAVQGLKNVRLVPVQHISGAVGVVLTHESGWKLVYSGDTRPCTALVNEGKGATVLIHEATFSDTLLGTAIERNHSTISEALDVAQKMRAWRLILTHFSQRYSGPPFLLEGSALLAFDHMHVRFSQCQHTELIAARMRKWFEEDSDRTHC